MNIQDQTSSVHDFAVADEMNTASYQLQVDPHYVNQPNVTQQNASSPVTSMPDPAAVSLPSPASTGDAPPLQPTIAALLSQMSVLGPSDRCSPAQAQGMGQQLLAVIAHHERNTVPLPVELQSSFDIFHRCLGVVYGTFFLNLYTKANAPCLLCHGCKSLYPPGQFIHHVCPALPANIVPCRSRMWRRCLVPLVSQGVDKVQQKQRWKYVLEKFSHSNTVPARRNPIPPEAEAQLLEMPELKRGRFIESPADSKLALAGSNGTQNLLDMEPTDYELEDGSPVESQIDFSKPSTTVGLAEQLLSEVKRLEQESAFAKTKLQAAQDIISKMPSEVCMREQLSQALAMQQTLTVERDQAREQAKLAQESAAQLRRQLATIRQAHCEIDKYFAA